jgi:branched-chain amino acid transport system permease protein
VTDLIPAYWEPIAVALVINGILALGLYVTLMSGQLSLAHAALAGVGGYASAVLTTKLGWPFYLALASGVALATVAAALIPLITMRLSQITQSLATLAFGETATVIAYNTDYIGGANSFFGIRLFTTLPITVAAAALVLYMVWRMERSSLGLSARAVRDDRTAAATSGINVPLVSVICFAIGGGIAGLAGGLSAHYTLVVNPADLAFAASFLILSYVLVGGSYNMWGPVLGAVLLTVLPQMLRFTVTYRFALVGLAIVLVIMFRPQGILPRFPFRRTSPTAKDPTPDLSSSGGGPD